MKFLVLLVFSCCLASGLAEQKKRYDGHQLLRVFPRDQAQLEFVYQFREDSDYDFWMEGRQRVDILVPPHKVANFKAQLTARDIFFSLSDPDIQKVVEAEQERLIKRATERGMAIDYDDFNTLDAIIGELDDMVKRCPPGVYCETFGIGQSYEGREITGIRIYRGTGRPAIWIDATIHAREWLSTATMLKIMKHLIDDFNDPQVENLLDTYDFYLIPVSNPDGYQYTWDRERLWRKNRRVNEGSSCLGIDLNRNYNQMWGNAGTSTNPCSDTYRGTEPASEVETQHVQAALLARASRLITSIHFHTYGQYWLIPWGSVEDNGACSYANDHNQMMIVAEAAANAVAGTYQTNWLRGNSCDTIYPASGITMDFSKGVAGVKYTVTPELRGNSFIVDKSQIQPSYVEIWNGVITHIRTIEAQGK